MGGRWAFALMLVLAGCTGGGSKESTPPVCPEPEVVSCPVCPEPKECPKDEDVLQVKNECFHSIEEREETIQKLRAEIQDLRGEILEAKSDAKDWQNRFYEVQRESCE